MSVDVLGGLPTLVRALDSQPAVDEVIATVIGGRCPGSRPLPATARAQHATGGALEEICDASPFAGGLVRPGLTKGREVSPWRVGVSPSGVSRVSFARWVTSGDRAAPVLLAVRPSHAACWSQALSWDKEPQPAGASGGLRQKSLFTPYTGSRLAKESDPEVQ